MSSISIALPAWLTMISAARTRVDAGVFASSINFIRIVAAAEEPCWSRAVVCPNAARRAFRKAAVELRVLHPAEQRPSSDSGRARSFVNVALGKQRSNRIFHLAPEFYSRSCH